MKISLIVPAYNEERYIGDCLLSIQKYGKGLFEVIVINNNSTDKTSEIVKNFPEFRLVEEPRQGLPFARNRGLREARGDLVAFVDADTRIKEGWINKITEEFEKNKDTVCVSGPYVYYDTSIFEKFLVWIYLIILLWPAYFIMGYMAILGNFVARKTALEEIGGFDNNIIFYGDDVDIVKRLNNIGKTKFFLTFYLYSSARRLKAEGILAIAHNYIISYLWIVFKNKPKINTDYKSIR